MWGYISAPDFVELRCKSKKFNRSIYFCFRESKRNDLKTVECTELQPDSGGTPPRRLFVFANPVLRVEGEEKWENFEPA